MEAEPSPASSGEKTADPSSRLKPLNLIWPVALSLAVLGLIGYIYYDPSQIGSIAADLNPWYLVAASALLVCRVLAGAARLQLISNRNLSFIAALRAQIFWDFASGITPSTIGGGPFAAPLIAADNKMAVGSVFGFMMFAMLLDQMWFALSVLLLLILSNFVAIYPASIGAVGAGVVTTYFVGLLLWVGIFAYATLLKPEMISRVIDRIFTIKWLKRFRPRLQNQLDQLQERARLLRTQRPAFYMKALGHTVVIWISRYVLLLFIALAFVPDLDQITFVLRSVGMMLGALVVPTPGGAGGLEGIYTLFLGPLMPSAAIAPTMLAWRIIAYYSLLVVGLFITTQVIGKRVANR